MSNPEQYLKITQFSPQILWTVDDAWFEGNNERTPILCDIPLPDKKLVEFRDVESAIRSRQRTPHPILGAGDLFVLKDLINLCKAARIDLGLCNFEYLENHFAEMNSVFNGILVDVHYDNNEKWLRDYYGVELVAELLKKHRAIAPIAFLTGFPADIEAYIDQNQGDRGWWTLRSCARIVKGKDKLGDFLKSFVDHLKGMIDLYTPDVRNSVVFEFFLPLNHESKLRAVLDSLFYKNELQKRIGRIDPEDVKRFLRIEMTQDEILTFVADKIGGYSINHVAGRFRALDLMSRNDAAKAEEQNQKRYLADETTAVVKFIIPCKSLEDESAAEGTPKAVGSVTPENREHPADRQAFDPPKRYPGVDEEDVHKIRFFFFRLFVQSIVELVSGEDEILLLEDGVEHGTHRWKKTRP